VLRKVDPAVRTMCCWCSTPHGRTPRQVDIFRQMTRSPASSSPSSTAPRGGVLVALAERFHLPIHAIGVGESADDLRPSPPPSPLADGLAE